MANDESALIPIEDVSSWLRSVVDFVEETQPTCLDLRNSPAAVSISKETDIKLFLDALTNSAVTQLYLKANNYSPRTNVVLRFLGILRDTKIERLSFNDFSMEEVLGLMAALEETQIAELDLTQSLIDYLIDDTFDQFVSHLASSNLTSLTLTNNIIRPLENISVLFQKQPDTLTHLNLSGCLPASDDNFFGTPVELLYTMFSLQQTAIKVLDLSRNGQGDSFAIAVGAVLANSKLERLNLSHNGITDSGVDYLVHGVVSSYITELNLANNEIKGDNSLGNFLKFTNLKELDLTANPIENGRMFYGSNFLQGSSIHTLKIRPYSPWTKTVLSIKDLSFSKLTCLDLSLINLNLEEVSLFADVLSQSKLTHVALSYNEFSDDCLSVLGNCLKRSKLKCINLSGTMNSEVSASSMALFLGEMANSEIVSVGFDGYLYHQLNEMLEQVPTNIIALSLAGVRCNYDISLLNKLKFIFALDVSQNAIIDNGAVILAQCIEKSQIVILSLSYNSITSQGVEVLALILKSTKLRHLDLKWNLIEADGLDRLAKHVRGTCIGYIDIEAAVKRPPLSYQCSIMLLDRVLWENRKRMRQFADLLKRTDFFTGDIDIFEFDRSFDEIHADLFVEDCLKLYKMVSEEPFIVNTIEQDKCILDLKNQECFKFGRGFEESQLNIYIENSELIYQRILEHPSPIKNKDISFFKNQILWLVLEKFPGKFVDFIGRRIEAEVGEHVSFLKNVEELGLSTIVELLLLNRPKYVIDENLDILHPYVYKLLLKYKQPVCNVDIEPKGVEKIVDYFTNHVDLDDAAEIISLLAAKNSY